MQLLQNRDLAKGSDLIQILHLEDNYTDRELVKALLEADGINCQITTVETKEEFVHHLGASPWDLILADYSLPAFDGLQALEIAQHACPGTPFIFVTGTMGEEKAIESLKSGATDYVLKQRMARLCESVRRALAENAEKHKREEAEAKLINSEEQLRRAEQKFRQIFEDAPEGIYQTTREGEILVLNPAGARMLGYASSKESVATVSDSANDAWLNLGDRARYSQLLEEQGEIDGFSCQLKRTDGTPIWVSLTARRVCGQDGQTLYYQGFMEDITERKAMEVDRVAKIRELHVLSEMNEALLCAKTEEELMKEYCRITVEAAGYRMAWVGFAEEGPEKRILPVAQYGHDDGYLKLLNVTWADTEQGRGPVGQCIRTGQIVVVKDFEADPTTALWREEALKRGYMSSIAIPFRQFEGEKACLTAYGVRVSRWSDTERRLMDQVASALGFGITTLRTGLAKAQFQENLRVSLEETILVVAGTLEQRDPYTAGHQRRVADLCVHIAEAMGLSADRTHGLQLAANIHDLGKIGTPTELLTKPGRLSKAEFSLIKDHAEMGYEIIKKVHFPWPIADMVRQHHERLDGSGYPLGLKAEATLLESRILAVADVVEAMSSQRPYRPSLGIDAALDNILAGRGTQFEPEVVDACVSLFRVEGYHLPA
jgi:PAS domain S-box-containing protein